MRVLARSGPRRTPGGFVLLGSQPYRRPGSGLEAYMNKQSGIQLRDPA